MLAEERPKKIYDENELMADTEMDEVLNLLSNDEDIGLTENEMTRDQKELIQAIIQQFKPEEDVKDLCILYEVTGYQGRLRDDTNFWYNYKDFFELGEDGNFIKKSNMNT